MKEKKEEEEEEEEEGNDELESLDVKEGKTILTKGILPSTAFNPSVCCRRNHPTVMEEEEEEEEEEEDKESYTLDPLYHSNFIPDTAMNTWNIARRGRLSTECL